MTHKPKEEAEVSDTSAAEKPCRKCGLIHPPTSKCVFPGSPAAAFLSPKKLEVEQQDELPAEVNYLRIEALRAASLVVSSDIAAKTLLPRDPDQQAIVYAEQFLRWLEGE